MSDRPATISPKRSVWIGRAIWLVLTVALVVAARDLPWQRAVQQLRSVSGSWLVVAVLANFAILPLWALEWRLLVPGTARVGFKGMFEIVSATASVLNSVPFFAGEASGVALLVTRAGLSRAAALAVLALDQLLVGFAKLVTIGTAASVALLPIWLRAGILSLVAGVAALLVIVLPLAHRWERIQEQLLARPTRARAFAARLASWGTHFDALRETHRLWRVAVLAIAKKGAELLGILAVQAAFGLDPSFAAAALVLAALAITTLLPVAPANLGVYEATVFAAYRYVGVPTETALGLALVQHACFLMPSVATGYAWMTARQLAPRDARA